MLENAKTAAALATETVDKITRAPEPASEAARAAALVTSQIEAIAGDGVADPGAVPSVSGPRFRKARPGEVVLSEVEMLARYDD